MTTPESMIAAKMTSLAGPLAGRIDEEFAPLVSIRETLRSQLLAAGEILPIPTAPASPPDSMCAIDGARIKDQMYAADLLMAVATAADARGTKTKIAVEPLVWADVVRHQDGTDRLAEAAMGSQEVALAASAPHQMRILDGSFATPVIALREGLFVRTPSIRDAVADLLLGDLAPIDALRALIEDGGHGVLSLPKSDSAVKYTTEYAARFDANLPVSDRFLATQVLHPGEMLAPRALIEMSHQKVDEPEGSAKVKRAATALRDTVARIAARAGSGQIQTTYFRPHAAGSGDSAGFGTVLRFEYLVDAGLTPTERGQLAAQHAAVIASDVYAPHLMEPFCQWLVDRQAKAISAGATSLRERMLSNLPKDRADSYRRLLAIGYRTGR